MYKEDLALNNLQWLMCQKTKPNQINALAQTNKNNYLNFLSYKNFAFSFMP